MPALPSWLIEPIWDQVVALLPAREDTHPLGCHRPRIPDRIVFDTLVDVSVFGGAYARIADATCSATTLRRRRDAWMAIGVMDTLHDAMLAADDRLIGLEIEHVAVDGCLTTAPCGDEVAGRSPVNRGTQGRKRSLIVDANGIPLGGIAAPASRPDAPLREATLDTLDRLGPLPEAVTVHLDRGSDAAPLVAGQRWVVERTHAWLNAFKKLVWCTERRAVVVGFWLAFAAIVVIVRRLMREGWMRSRWDGRPTRRP